MTKTTTNSNDLLVTKTQHILSSSTTEWNLGGKKEFPSPKLDLYLNIHSYLLIDLKKEKICK